MTRWDAVLLLQSHACSLQGALGERLPLTGRGLIRDVGLAVPVSRRDTNGVAICNPVRSFDIPARLQAKTARFIEALDKATVDEIVAQVVSAIDPASDDS